MASGKTIAADYQVNLAGRAQAGLQWQLCIIYSLLEALVGKIVGQWHVEQLLLNAAQLHTHLSAQVRCQRIQGLDNGTK